MNKPGIICLTMVLSSTPGYAYSFDLDPFNIKEKLHRKKEKTVDFLHFTHDATKKVFGFVVHKHEKKKDFVHAVVEHKIDKTEKVIDVVQQKHEKKKEFVHDVIEHKVEKKEKVIDLVEAKHEKKKEIIHDVIEHKVEKKEKIVDLVEAKHEKKKDIIHGVIEHKVEKKEKVIDLVEAKHEKKEHVVSTAKDVIAALIAFKKDLLPDHHGPSGESEGGHSGTWLKLWATHGDIGKEGGFSKGKVTGEGFSIFQLTDSGNVVSSVDCSEGVAEVYVMKDGQLSLDGGLSGTFENEFTLSFPAVEYSKSVTIEGVAFKEVGFKKEVMVKLSGDHNSNAAWSEDSSAMDAELFCSAYSSTLYKSAELHIEKGALLLEGATVNESWKADPEGGVAILRKGGTVSVSEPGRTVNTGML